MSTVAMIVTYNEPYGNPGLSLPIPTRTNYDFIGWFTQANGGVQVIDSTIVTNPNEHTLYAHWSESTLCFDADVVMRNGCWSALSYENGVYTGERGQFSQAPSDIYPPLKEKDEQNRQ